MINMDDHRDHLGFRRVIGAQKPTLVMRRIADQFLAQESLTGVEPARDQQARQAQPGSDIGQQTGLVKARLCIFITECRIRPIQDMLDDRLAPVEQWRIGVAKIKRWHVVAIAARLIPGPMLPSGQFLPLVVHLLDGRDLIGAKPDSAQDVIHPISQGSLR
ncbi:hypothetical protein [Azospirillum sp. RU37A]|uniref:hypothetical protein n=1 Tax=Azospirillum sp. RU37A TaxID=1907312 RepID=UPI001178919F|nr:hypothetical protein [Azospirillum sp. RU37A]